MDNVVTIMGDYADDLEDVVARKTLDLDKEKKKTDALLNRMLPKFVEAKALFVDPGTRV